MSRRSEDGQPLLQDFLQQRLSIQVSRATAQHKSNLAALLVNVTAKPRSAIRPTDNQASRDPASYLRPDATG